MTYQRAYPQNQVILLASGNGMFGRATYYKPLRLWDNATENLTDFTTHFSFIIDSQNRSAYGDGLTFFLAPQVSMIPVSATRGGSFGLANDDERLNSTSNPFFAVEFDIYQNHYDPPSSREHVGIDINSLQSVKTVAWWSDVMGGRRNEAWINYNSSTKNLSVEFTGFRNGTIVKQHLDYKVDLRLYLPELLSLEDGNSTNPPMPVSPNLVDGRRKSKTGLAVGLGIVGGVLVGRVGFDSDWLALVGREMGKMKKKLWIMNLKEELDPKSFLKKVSKESKQGIKEYASEVKIISRLRRRNLVQLLGWCHEKRNLLLVYEFMRNGSLDCHLFKGKSLLTWEMRFKPCAFSVFDYSTLIHL
ncbi:hypothetical protein Patl1_37068 [Pistacia atlantica]|nr:hypothetical protein Patl1_37068 [Pistacia atlantica]